MFAKRDKQDPNRSGQTSVDTAEIDFTKPVIKIYFGHSTSNSFSFCMFSPAITQIRIAARKYIRDMIKWDV